MATINKNTIKVVGSLIEAGIRTAKDISSLGLKEMLDMPNLTKGDMKTILDLQDAIREDRLFECFVDVGEPDRSDAQRRKKPVDSREGGMNENA